MLRSALAILAGLIVILVASFGIEAAVTPLLLKMFPVALPNEAAMSGNLAVWLFTFAYTLLCVVAAGYVTARLAKHHAVRHAHAMHSFHKGMSHKAALAGDTTGQLNREELARIQSGNLSNPPAPPAAGPGATPGPGSDMSSPTTTNRMSTGGRATSGTNMH